MMHSPSCALVMPTLTWCGSVMNPSRFIIQDLVGCLSMSDFGQERTVDMMTYFHSLPVAKQTKEKRSEIILAIYALIKKQTISSVKTFINTA